jgi:hypothetical protein
VLAAEEVDMMEASQVARGPPAPAAVAPPPPLGASAGGEPVGLFTGDKGVLVDNLTGADVRMMKVRARGDRGCRGRVRPRVAVADWHPPALPASAVYMLTNPQHPSPPHPP